MSVKSNLIYPYNTYSEGLDIKPVFKGLTGGPLVLDMSVESPIFNQVDVLNQKVFQTYIYQLMKDNYSWGIAAYLEDRQKVLSQYPQMVEEQRYYHLGIDIIVPLGTPLYAPLNSVVHISDYESGDGNYGAHVLLRHESPDFETFYSLYGHLDRQRLPKINSSLIAGEPFAFIGDFCDNGNWFYHTHLQILTQMGLDQGYLSKGYCALKDLKKMDKYCPSPLSLFKV